MVNLFNTAAKAATNTKATQYKSTLRLSLLAIALTGMVRAFLSPIYNALFARVLPREHFARGAGLGAVVVAFLLSAAPINGVGHGFQIAAVTARFGAVMSGSRVRRRPAEPDKEVEAV